MRLSIEYEMSGQYLPKDYRTGYMSLIKAAIQSSNPRLYDEYYNRRKLKPFTFATYFPDIRGSHDGYFDVGKTVILNFSTSSNELAVYLYNGFCQLENYPMFQNMINRKKVTLRKTPEIRSNEVTFKTVSSVLVNNLGKANWYLLPGEEGFLEGLQFATNEITREFLGKIIDAHITFVTLQIKRKVIRHYNIDMSSFTGVFKLIGKPEILQLIYDVGLGVRRSQGFGMLELVKQEGK